MQDTHKTGLISLSHKRRMAGFTLLETMAVITILSIVMAPVFYWYSLYENQRKAKETQERITASYEALIKWQKFNGFFPLPAGPKIARPSYDVTSMGAGMASGTRYGYALPDANRADLLSKASGVCDDALGGICIQGTHRVDSPAIAPIPATERRVIIGALPFRDINMREADTYDAYGSRLYYAVSYPLTQKMTDDSSGPAVEKVITGLSKAAAAQVTATAHGYAVGDLVQFSDVVGMTEINSVRGTVASVVDANTFTVNIDSSAFADYTSGGKVKKITQIVSFQEDRGLIKIQRRDQGAGGPVDVDLSGAVPGSFQMVVFSVGKNRKGGYNREGLMPMACAGGDDLENCNFLTGEVNALFRMEDGSKVAANEFDDIMSVNSDLNRSPWLRGATENDIVYTGGKTVAVGSYFTQRAADPWQYQAASVSGAALHVGFGTYGVDPAKTQADGTNWSDGMLYVQNRAKTDQLCDLQGRCMTFDQLEKTCPAGKYVTGFGNYGGADFVRCGVAFLGCTAENTYMKGVKASGEPDCVALPEPGVLASEVDSTHSGWTALAKAGEAAREAVAMGKSIKDVAKAAASVPGISAADAAAAVAAALAGASVHTSLDVLIGAGAAAGAVSGSSDADVTAGVTGAAGVISGETAAEIAGAIAAGKALHAGKSSSALIADVVAAVKAAGGDVTTIGRVAGLTAVTVGISTADAKTAVYAAMIGASYSVSDAMAAEDKAAAEIAAAVADGGVGRTCIDGTERGTTTDLCKNLTPFTGMCDKTDSGDAADDCAARTYSIIERKTCPDTWNPVSNNSRSTCCAAGPGYSDQYVSAIPPNVTSAQKVYDFAASGAILQFSAMVSGSRISSQTPDTFTTSALNYNGRYAYRKNSTTSITVEREKSASGCDIRITKVTWPTATSAALRNVAGGGGPVDGENRWWEETTFQKCVTAGGKEGYRYYQQPKCHSGINVDSSKAVGGIVHENYANFDDKVKDYGFDFNADYNCKENDNLVWVDVTGSVVGDAEGSYGKPSVDEEGSSCSTSGLPRNCYRMSGSKYITYRSCECKAMGRPPQTFEDADGKIAKPDGSGDLTLDMTGWACGRLPP